MAIVLQVRNAQKNAHGFYHQLDILISRYSVFLFEQVVQKDPLFIYQIFCFFLDTWVEIPMDFLFANWLNIIQKH